MTGALRFLGYALLLAGVIGCAGSPAGHSTTAASEFVTPLPGPDVAGGVSLHEALSHRRSVREFAGTPLTDRELGQLLWAAQGITDERGFRTAPSAGALYPLEIYVATAGGVYRYRPEAHGLQTVSGTDARDALCQAGLRQTALRTAPSIVVIAAVYGRTASKYGAQRSQRFVHLEAGHAAQNILLEAVALGLGAVPIGAFDDRAVQEALGLALEHEPLYLIPVGRRAGWQ